MRRVSRRMSVALGASPRPEASPNTALSPLRTAEPGALSAVESAAEGDDEEDQREEMLARVAELEELLEESETKLETAASIGQQMVTRLQYLDEENEELRAAAGAGVGGALGVTSAQHAALEADFAAAQAELEQRTDELAEAQGQQAWLESQATGAEKAQLQGVIDDQAVALQEKGEVIASLERELAAGKGRERTHEEALAQLEEVVGGLRRQVSRAEVVQVRLVRDKQLADAMRFATETKVEALEEKLATAETVIDHAKRCVRLAVCLHVVSVCLSVYLCLCVCVCAYLPLRVRARA
jgi:chromosome segregation ATPase